MKNKISGILAGLLLFSLGTPAFADIQFSNNSTRAGQYRKVNLDSSTGLAIDASGNITSTAGTITPTAVTASGAVTFQSTLIANGRPSASSTLASSSTSLGTGNIAYGVVVKSIGNVASEGTNLHDGSPGQSLFLEVVVCGTSGTWVITPDTSRIFRTLTIATAPVVSNLLFWDTTMGWVPQGGVGTQTYSMKGLFGA